MFHVVQLPVLQAPGVEFSRELASKVQGILLRAETTFEDAKVLCEYLDCCKAKLTGLNKAFAFSATSVLRNFLEQSANAEERRALARLSPAVRSMQLSPPVESTAPVLLREYA